MSDLKKERLIELLTDNVLFGLDEVETAELEVLKQLYPDIAKDNSLEMTAGLIGLSSIEQIEPMPDHLQTMIRAKANDIFESADIRPIALVSSDDKDGDFQKTFEFEKKRGLTQLLGWMVAGAACIALAFSLWFNLQEPKIIREYVGSQPVPSVIEQERQLIARAKDLIRTPLVDPAASERVIGEIVWSDSEQKGFMKFNGLAVNDIKAQTYQLWIFDKTQDEKTPIDGGVFDIKSQGETIIPITAKLKVAKPGLFAVTVEKPGGVVVSKREKIAALGKIQS